MVNIFDKKSITTRLSFYVACASIVIFCAIIFFFINILKTLTVKHGIENVNLISEASTHEIQGFFNQNIVMSKVLKSTALDFYTQDPNNINAIQTLVENQMGNFNDVYAIGLVLAFEKDKKATKVLFSARVDGLIENKVIALADAPFDLASINTNKPSLSSPFNHDINGNKQLFSTYSSPIVRGQQTVGMIYTLISLAKPQELVRKTKPLGGGYMALFSNDSTYVYYPKTERIGSKMSERPGNEARAQAVHDGEVFVRNGFISTTSAKASYSKVSPLYFHTIEEPWAIQPTITLENILALITESTYQAMGIGFIGLIILMSGVTILFKILVRAPLQHIQTITTGFSQGIFDKRLTVSSGDEIGSTAESINMALDVVVEKMSWYESILDTLSSPVIVSNLLGEASYVNKAAELMTKMPRELLIGKTCDLMQNKEIQLAVFKAMAKGEDSFFYSSKDQSKAFSVRLTKMTDTSNKHIGYIQVITDVTDLVRLKTSAEAASQSKGDFLARMSHEIRTPMNAIMGMIYLCLQTSLNDQQKTYLIKANSATKNLLVIIDDILDFSKIEAGKFQIELSDFSLDATLKMLADMMDIKAKEKNINFIINIAPNTPDLLCGASSRLLQVLINICGNSLKFTETGFVSVTVHAIENADKTIRLEFAIKDTGIGISADKVKTIFDPFEQGEGSVARKFGGTGLGLAISKSLIELMQGEIWIESTPDVGSVFSFYITVTAGNAENISEESCLLGDTCSAQLNGARILLVEDNEINQEIALEILTQFGAIVTVANNGKEAVAAALKTTYDLILMDIAMPEMGGIEATQLIRANEKESRVPIIAMTAHALVDDKDKSLAAGMNDHITKPIDVQELHSKILEWL